MTSEFLEPHADHNQPGLRTEHVRSHAEMLAAQAQANAAKRQLEFEELRSDLNSPEQRVRVWEKVHGLSLPRDPEHPILDLIATKTRLTLQEVREVQRKYAVHASAEGHRKP